MRQQSAIRKFLISLAFLVFLGVSYLAVNVMTACRAEAMCHCSICVFPPGVAGAINTIYSSIISPGVQEAEQVLSAHFSTAAEDFTDTVTEKIAEITPRITDWFDTFWYYNLLPAMQAQTRQLGTMNTDQQRALGSQMDAANLNRVKKAQEEQEILSHREQRPSERICVATSAMGGMGRAAAFTRAYAAAAPAEKLDRSANAAGTPAAAGMAADMNERWQTYVTRYCRKNYNNGAAGCTEDKPFPDHDIDVTGTIFRRDTIDLKNPDIKKEVDDLISNIAEPFVKEPVPPGAVNSAGGQEAMLDGEAYKARRQVIYNALYHIVSRRAPGSGMGSIIRPIRENAGVAPGVIGSNPSRNEILQAVMIEKYRNGKNGLAQVDEPENNERELVMQQAFQIMQMTEQLDLMDRYSLILAAQMGEEINQTKSGGSASSGAPLK